MTFQQKLDNRMDAVRSFLCVGLDSEIGKIPERFRSRKTPQFDFNKYIIDETHRYVCAYKPNIAFYEARGISGLQELKMTLEYMIRQYPDIPVICDAKRGDIGSTNEGYVTSVFDYFQFDAVTVSPYLGKEALMPFLSRKDKGCIILCKTSNPGSGEFQDMRVGEKPLWHAVALHISTKWNENKNCFLVVGATYPGELAEIRTIVGDMTLLVPGVGAQGGDLAQVVKYGMNSRKKGLIINSSRGVIFAEHPGEEAEKLQKEMKRLSAI